VPGLGETSGAPPPVQGLTLGEKVTSQGPGRSPRLCFSPTAGFPVMCFALAAFAALVVFGGVGCE